MRELLGQMQARPTQAVAAVEVVEVVARTVAPAVLEDFRAVVAAVAVEVLTAELVALEVLDELSSSPISNKCTS
jgi:hypothetical protein